VGCFAIEKNVNERERERESVLHYFSITNEERDIYCRKGDLIVVSTSSYMPRFAVLPFVIILCPSIHSISYAPKTVNNWVVEDEIQP